MKIDKRNVGHWLLLTMTGINALIASLLRFVVSGRRRSILLYGHKLGGNLLAIHRHLVASRPDVEVTFLTMDPGYHKALLREGVASLLATSPGCIRKLVRARALVSDHGLHTLVPLTLTDLAFFDAWHAIPFKGFDAADFRVHRRYRETWVASPLMAGKYVDQYGFRSGQVKVTGYARTDRLVRGDSGAREALRKRLGLPDLGKVVLFAPTWKQDAAERSELPFGIPAGEFLGALSRLACRHGAIVVFRTHLNSGGAVAGVQRYEGVVGVPYADYPDTEEILLATDVLVCDWSSIAFDFLLLDRPTIFLDVPPPFRKGFTLGPEYRFGHIVGDMAALLHAIEHFLGDPDAYHQRYGALAAGIKREVYGAYADGQSAARCVARLDHVLRGTPAADAS